MPWLLPTILTSEQTTTRRTLVSSTLLIGTVNVTARIAQLVFAVVVLRGFHVSVYGQYSVAIVVASLTQAFVQGGLRVTGVRDMARDPRRQADLVVDVSAIWLAAVMVSAPLVLTIVWLLDYPTQLLWAIAVLLVALVPALIWQALTMVCDSQLHFELSAPAALAIQVVGMAAGLLLAFGGLGIIGLVAGVLIANAVVPVAELLVTGAKWLPRIRPRLRPSRWGGLFLEALPIGLVNWFVIVNYRFDSLALLQLRGARDVGFYSAAYSLIFGLAALSGALQTALLPALSSQSSGKRLETTHLLLTFRYGLSVAALVAVVGFAVADPVVRFLYGGGFTPSSSALEILIWAIPFMLVSSILFPAQVAAGRTRYLAWAYGGLVVFNVASNLLLIPWLGIVGASISTVTSEAVISLLLVRGLWESQAVRSLLRWTVLIALATLVGIAAAAAGQQMGLVMKLWPIVGLEAALAYCGALLFLGVVQPASVIRLAQQGRDAVNNTRRREV